MKIAIIGNGKMGRVFSERLAAQGILIVATRRGDDNRSAVTGVDAVIIAVKPKDLAVALAQLKGCIPAGATVLSIVAGKQIEEIANRLNHLHIVRAMPNLPGQTGNGMTGWIVSGAVGDAAHEQVRLILSSIGKEVEFVDEDNLNGVTALSGSGPAYVCMFILALVDAGVRMGIERAVAYNLVLETIIGTLEYLRKSNVSPDELIKRVQTQGGTTEAAFIKFAQHEVRQYLSDGVFAAYLRSRELGT